MENKALKESFEAYLDKPMLPPVGLSEAERLEWFKNHVDEGLEILAKYGQKQTDNLVREAERVLKDGQKN